MDNQPLDTAAVAELLGLEPATISRYRTESLKPGGRYYNYPFPAPNGFISGAPYWLFNRIFEIESWNRGRPGKGSGGGRPTRKGM